MARVRIVARIVPPVIVPVFLLLLVCAGAILDG
ncbi:hypothetical protein ABIA95_001721 [Bradyrhizobium sp. LA8.1]